MSWLDGLTYLMDMNLSQLQETGRTEKPGVLKFMGPQRVEHDLATEQQSVCTCNYIFLLHLYIIYKIIITTLIPKPKTAQQGKTADQYSLQYRCKNSKDTVNI